VVLSGEGADEVFLAICILETAEDFQKEIERVQKLLTATACR
jgi:asparagine synthetase B (glutamine-hydrolysing)